MKTDRSLVSDVSCICSDTAGQEEYQAMLDQVYRSPCDLFLWVVDASLPLTEGGNIASLERFKLVIKTAKGENLPAFFIVRHELGSSSV